MYFQILTFFFALSLCITQSSIADNPSEYENLNFPLPGKRCTRLKEKHRYKKNFKLKLSSLLEHNLSLQKKLSSHELTLKDRFIKNEKELKIQLRETIDRLAYMEEDMVRKGCPGIRLQHVSAELDSIMKVLE